MHPTSLDPGIVEGTRRHLEGVEPATQVSQHRLRVASTDLAGVPELAVVVVADEERAEANPAARRVGETSDHELLAPGALELQPVGRPSRTVGGIGPLGDHPLPGPRARGLEGSLALRVAVPGEPQSPAEPEGAELGLPGAQRQLSDVVAVDVQHIEQVVVDGDGTATGEPGVGDAHALLQPGEAGSPVLERDDLAVHDEIGGLLRSQHVDELRVGTVERLPLA